MSLPRFDRERWARGYRHFPDTSAASPPRVRGRAVPDAAGDDEAANDRHVEDAHVAWSVRYGADPRRPERWHVVADA